MTNKEKRTEDLLNKLASTEQEPKRLLGSKTRALIISIIALAYMAVTAFFLYTPRSDLFEQYGNINFTLEQLCALLVGVLGAMIATSYSVPGKTPSKLLKGAVLSLLLALVGFVAFSGHTSYNMPETSFLIKGMHCAFDICVFALPPAGLALYMIVKAAPTKPMITGFFAILSMTAFAYFSVRTVCSVDNFYHQTTAHILPLIIFSLVGFWIGHKLLRW